VVRQLQQVKSLLVHQLLQQCEDDICDGRGGAACSSSLQ
jgi:hypothetical protein